MPASSAAWMVAMLSAAVGRAVHARHAHAAEADRRDLRPVGAELARLHRPNIGARPRRSSPLAWPPGRRGKELGMSEGVQTGTIETRHPGAAGPAAVVALSLDGDHRARHGLDPRRPRGDVVGSISSRLSEHGRGRRASPPATSPGWAASLYIAGRLPRRARVRAADRPLRAQAAVHDHARHVSARRPC